MFRAAAQAVADATPLEVLDLGRVFPALEDMRSVSFSIAAAIAEVAFDEGLADVDRPIDIHAYILQQMYTHEY